jgi:GrpB-like predicted nucleotidyltransferase (UPF0157 family)/RimJ/RimL family protein N-acetyltransferase
MPVVVEQYNSDWPNQFKIIQSELRSFLEGVDIVSIEHVGSTSVPGLAAKPIIDVDIIVSRENVQPAIDALVARKYTYLGELGIEDRHALRSPEQDPPRNIYIVVDGCFQLRNHLGVRNTLRNDRSLRDEYGRVKLGLAEKGLEIVEYVEAKSEIVTTILVKSGLLSEDEITNINQANRKQERFGAIRTERLVLREFVMDDFAVMHALESLPEVVQYQTFAPLTVEEAKERVANILRTAAEIPREYYELAVLHEGDFIGRVGARVKRTFEGGEPRNPPHADLWFSFLPSAQGKGFATEATEALIPLLGSPLLLEIECDPRNSGSWKLAERLGFQRVSFTENAFQVKGEMVGSLVYQKTV